MYPRGELNRLAARKALLEARIELRRLECQLHAHRLAQPLHFADRARAQWRRIGPLVKLIGVPVAIWAVTKWARRKGGGGKLAGWLKYAPLAIQAAQAFARARQQQAEEPATVH